MASALVVGAMLIGAWLRLANLDVLLFSNDEAEWSNAALSIARGENFPLIGIPSLVSINTGPAFLYILALPMLISPDPAFVTAFIGLVSLVTVALAYLFTRRYFGTLAAVSSTLLFATAPWAVYHSRKVWNPNLLPLFALVFYWALYMVVVERRPRFLLLAAGACAVAIQLNQAGLLLIPVLVLVAVARRDIVDRFSLLGAAVVGLVLSAPYLYYETAHGWSDLAQAAQVAGGGANVDAEALRLGLSMVAGWGFPGDIFGIWTRPGETVPDFSASSLLVTVAVVAGLAVALGRTIRPRGEHAYDRAVHGLLLIWAFVPPLILARHGFEMHMRYLLTAQAAAYVLAGVGVAASVDALRHLRSPAPFQLSAAFSAIPLAAILLVAGSQARDYLEVLRMIADNGLEQSYGIPLRYYRQAVDTTARLRASGQFAEVVIRTNPGNVQTLRYLTRLQGFKPRFNTERDTLLLPATDGDVLYVDSRAHAEPDRRWQRLGMEEVPEERVVVLGNQNSFRFLRAGPDVATAIRDYSDRLGAGARWANGVEILGAEVQRGPDRLSLVIAWQWWREPVSPGGDPTLCLAQHVVDRGGADLAVRDVAMESTFNLRLGDLQLTQVEAPLPVDASRQQAWLDISLFGCWKREQLEFSRFGGQNGGSLRVATLAVGAPLPALEEAPRWPLSATFGGALTLLGADLDLESGSDEVALTLYWRSDAPIEEDYTVFVQMVDAEGLVAQHDSMPAGGIMPTSLWEIGEIVADQHTIALPPEVPRGDYRLIVGLYNLADMRRLPVLTGAGSVGSDHLELGRLRWNGSTIRLMDTFNR